MWSDPRFAEAWARLPDYLGSHVRVSLAALALGMAVSFPLALACVRRPALRGAALGFANVAQTIPGLALLALFYPLLVGLAALSERFFGFSFSALGFLPAVLALALYSMLPILRNTVAGLGGIDPAVAEATRGVGMTPGQALRMVELPLALPIIMAGVRTAAVWVVGTATLSTPIGQPSLGNYIFAGLQTQNWALVLFGCTAVAGLALVFDALLMLVETGLGRRKRVRVAGGLAGLAFVLALALAPGFAARDATYRIGAKTFTEQYILAALVEQRLAAAGLTAARREGLGSSVIFEALASGEIDVYVDYSGTLWANILKREDAKPAAEMVRELGEKLRSRYGITLVGTLGFENAYALAMPRNKAEALSIRSIADLAGHAPSLAIAGDYEFFERPEWRALRDGYRLSFRAQRTMQPEFMYPAASAGDVDVIAAYTSDGRIAQHDLVVLDDPRHAIPPYDAVLLVSARRANDRALLDALRPLLGGVSIDAMREANARAGGGSSPEAAARALWERIARAR